MIPSLANIFSRGLIIVIATGLIPLSPLSTFFRRWFCGKAATGLEGKLYGVLVKESQESNDRWTGRHDITEILLKTVLKPCNQSISQSNINGIIQTTKR